MNWKKFLSNPKVVLVYSLFGGAIAAQIDVALRAGHLDWSWSGIGHMLAGAAATTFLTLYHLYQPKPGLPDMPAGSVVNVQTPLIPATETKAEVPATNTTAVTK